MHAHYFTIRGRDLELETPGLIARTRVMATASYEMSLKLPRIA